MVSVLLLDAETLLPVPLPQGPLPYLLRKHTSLLSIWCHFLLEAFSDYLPSRCLDSLCLPHTYTAPWLYPFKAPIELYPLFSRAGILELNPLGFRHRLRLLESCVVLSKSLPPLSLHFPIYKVEVLIGVKGVGPPHPRASRDTCHLSRSLLLPLVPQTPATSWSLPAVAVAHLRSLQLLLPLPDTPFTLSPCGQLPMPRISA